MRLFILTITFLCSLGLKLNAQEVQKNYINYQGVANDVSGNAIANTAINIQIALKLGSTTVVASYVENHAVTTTDKGMFSLQIGSGTLVAGNYNTIEWGNDAVFLTVSINGSEIGTTELIAVPYALSSGDNQWSTASNAIENKNTGKVSIANNLEVGTTLKLENGSTVNEFSTDGTLDDNSDTAIPTEKAIKTYVDARESSGLEFITEGSNSGWRFKNRNPSSYGDIGAQAVDFSLSLSSSSTFGATGSNAAAFGFFTTASGDMSFVTGSNTTAAGDMSFATGHNTTASGETSFATGRNTDASGDFSTALGYVTSASGAYSTTLGANTTASGFVSTALGYLTTSSGNYSLALGSGVTAKSFSEVAIGANNTDYTPNSTTEWNTDDRLFVVGNGSSTSSTNDALTIYKNGNAVFDGGVEIGTTLKLENGSSINEFSTDGTFSGNSDSVIPTEKAIKTYINASASTGLESLNEGNGVGRRLKGRNFNNYGNIGFDAVDFSNSTVTSAVNGATGNYSAAFGLRTVASGEHSIAIGDESIASGLTSVALGYRTEATGSRATAFGSLSKAIGSNATAMGFSSEASGITSVAVGSNTIASGNYTSAFGRFSEASGFASLATGANTIASGNYAASLGINTLARSYGEVALGTYNTDYTPNSETSWSFSDKAFVVGNGTSTTDRRDAFTVYKSGSVELSGNIELGGEIQRPATGSADMLPVAYGTVSAGGTVFSGTGNFTVSLSNNVYTISVTGESLASTTSVCSVTPFTSSFPTVSNISYSSGTLKLRFYKLSDTTLAPVSFQFVIYKL